MPLSIRIGAIEVYKYKYNNKLPQRNRAPDMKRGILLGYFEQCIRLTSGDTKLVADGPICDELLRLGYMEDLLVSAEVKQPIIGRLDL